MKRLEDMNESVQKRTPKRKSKTSSKIPHLELFGQSMLELRRYKIKKVLSHEVLLAVQYDNLSGLGVQQQMKKEHQKGAADGNEVVIKTIQKSACVYRIEDDTFSRTSILPISVSYMTKLVRYYENDDFLHLVLEYVPGGELYRIIEHFFKNKTHPLQANDKIESEQDFTDMKGKEELKNSSMKTFSTITKEPLNQSSQISCPSPYGAKSISVIKPSSSFINIRKKSLVKQLVDNLTPSKSRRKTNIDSSSKSTFYVDQSPEERDGDVSPSDSMSSINYVCTYTDDNEEDTNDSSGNAKLICINKDGIESIDCDSNEKKIHDESFDFVDDFADETGQDVTKTTVLNKMRLSSSVEENLDFSSFDLEEDEDSIRAILNKNEAEYKPPEIVMTLAGKLYTEPVKLVQDSKSLLDSVSSKLEERQSENKSAEHVLSRLENVESKIQTHLSQGHASPMCSTLATPYEHTPAKVPPSYLFTPQEVNFPLAKEHNKNSSISPLSPSTVATTPTSVMSSPPKCSSSSSEAASPTSDCSREYRSNSVKLWDIVPYYDHLNLRLTNCIPIGLIRKWCAQICKALFSLHSRGIIIQDLRPRNLLLGMIVHSV